MADHPRYTELKTAMLVHVPFFSSLMFDMMNVHVGEFPEVFGDRSPTAATDGKTIWFDEKFLAKQKLPQAVGLACHEIGHAIYMHMARAKEYDSLGLGGKKFNHRKWNKACDYVINDMLVKCGLKLPDGGLLDSKYTCDMGAEEVYLLLPDEEDDGGGSLDVHIPASPQTSTAEMKRAVQSAADSAKSVGKLPKELERFATEFVTPQVTWQERLRYQVSKAIARDGTTWAKPHRRRLIAQGIYLPAMTGFGAGDVVVAIDTSGSIGQHELNVFFSELDAIMTSCRPSSVTLIGCDAAIGRIHRLEDGEMLEGQQLPLDGGGGTDFNPPFNWVKEQDGHPSALIYFTDMCGPFPPEAPPYPVIWCRTHPGEAPFGEHIDVEVNRG